MSSAQSKSLQSKSLAILMLVGILSALFSTRADAQQHPESDNVKIASWSFAAGPLTAEYWEKVQADVVALRDFDSPEAASKIFRSSAYDIHTTSGRFRSRTGFAIRKDIKYTRHDDVAGLGLTASQAPALTAAADISIHMNRTSIRLLAVQLYRGCTEQHLYQTGENCALLRRQAAAVAGWVSTHTITGKPFMILGEFGRMLSDNDEVWRIISIGTSAGLHRMPRRHTQLCEVDQSEWRSDYIVLGRRTRAWAQAPGNYLARYVGSLCPLMIALSQR